MNKYPPEVKALIKETQLLRGQLIVDRNYAKKNGPEVLVHNCTIYLNKIDKALEPFKEK